MTQKLTDLQLVLLSNAAARAGGSLLPWPESVSDQLARIRKAIPALLRRELVAEVDVANAALAWRDDEGRRIGVIITATGHNAIGADVPVDHGQGNAPAPSEPVKESVPTQPSEIAPPMRPTKSAAVLTLLRRSRSWSRRPAGCPTPRARR